jgi:Pyruvate/2-oxoacid:ferredoxin oxidoreductase delta subunit
MKDVYEKLARHLDRMPAGFPSTDTGVELRILKRLFTPQEAEIAIQLFLKPEPASIIAKRAGLDADELSPVLEAMSKKGLILRSGKGKELLFMAAQFMIGIWEYHVNDLDEGLIRDFNEYVPHLVSKTWSKQRTKQLRVIPVSTSIQAEMEVMPYEAAEKIIQSQSKIVVAPCICRKEHRMVGKGCDKPMEACLIFGGSAYYYEENGLGRTISKGEALEILKKGMASGLVLQPGNSQKPSNICMCCGCCCQILKNIKVFDRPAELVCTSYYAEVEAENCTACGECAAICQMTAITVDDVALVEKDRCIGCGLCVSVCDFDALRLIQKEKPKQWVPPRNLVETYMTIAQERIKQVS